METKEYSNAEILRDAARRTAERRKVLKAEADAFTKNLLEEAKEDGIGLVHVHGAKGGLTIAFRPANEFKGCRMVEVAVKVCSIEDTFNRRAGSTGALLAFYANDTIQLPLLVLAKPEDLAQIVKRSFTAMYIEMLTA